MVPGVVVHPNLGRLMEVLRRGGYCVAFRSVSSLTTCSELTIRIAQRAIELERLRSGRGHRRRDSQRCGNVRRLRRDRLGGGVVVPISRELPDIKVSELSERTNMAAIATRYGRVLHLERKFPSVAIPEEVALVLFTTGSTGAPREY